MKVVCEKNGVVEDVRIGEDSKTNVLIKVWKNSDYDVVRARSRDAEYEVRINSNGTVFIKITEYDYDADDEDERIYEHVEKFDNVDTVEVEYETATGKIYKVIADIKNNRTTAEYNGTRRAFMKSENEISEMMKNIEWDKATVYTTKPSDANEFLNGKVKARKVEIVGVDEYTWRG